MTDTPTPFRPRLWLENSAFRGMVRLLQGIPYAQRLAVMSWLTRRVIGPAVGYRGRALRNLALIYPDKPLAERRAIADQVLDSMGRTVMENYSRKEFRANIATHQIEGPGLAAARAAQEAGRPIIFSSGHWSNHEATRTALDLAGFSVGAIYNPMKNQYFNQHYVESITDVSGPVFPRGRDGMRDFLQFLSKGGHAFLLHDVYFAKGLWFDFLGRPAKTAVSAAQIALRFDALLIPYFNTRQPDGTRFKIELLEPIPHTDPAQMTRALMDLLEDRIAQDPGQWLWVHRRWKGKPPARPSEAPQPQ